MGKIKQVIIIRKDLGMTAGKIASQAAHASLEAFLLVSKQNPDLIKQWIDEGQTKIVLKVNSLAEFEELKNKLKENNIPFAVVSDSGLTQVAPGTETAIGIGPIDEGVIDNITKNLKLL